MVQRGDRWSVPSPHHPDPDDDAWWSGLARFFRIDPGAAYARLDVPVLAVFGEYDRKMSGAQQATVLRRTLQRSGHPDHDVRLLSRASHGLMETIYDARGRREPFRRFVPGWHDRMVAWVMERVGLRVSGR